MTLYHDAGEAVFADKLVIIFKSNLNVQPAEDQPELSFARIQGDPARAIIPETIRLVSHKK